MQLVLGPVAIKNTENARLASIPTGSEAPEEVKISINWRLRKGRAQEDEIFHNLK